MAPAHLSADCNISDSGRHWLRSADVRTCGSTQRRQSWRQQLCRRRTTSVEPAASQHVTSRLQLRTFPTKTEDTVFSATRSTALCDLLICSTIEELLLTYLLTYLNTYTVDLLFIFLWSINKVLDTRLYTPCLRDDVKDDDGWWLQLRLTFTLNSFSTCASCFISCLSWKVVMIGSWLDSAMYAGLASAR